ncbi:hypothetical protein IWZ01DRAFT_512302 [Phyllosticta capitalensis]
MTCGFSRAWHLRTSVVSGFLAVLLSWVLEMSLGLSAWQLWTAVRRLCQRYNDAGCHLHLSMVVDVFLAQCAAQE